MSSVDLEKLEAMLVAAKMPTDTLRVEYDADDGEYSAGDGWAYRIKHLVNFVEEMDETWPAMRLDSDGFGWIDPRAEYIALALNSMIQIIAELKVLRAAVGLINEAVDNA